MMRWTLKPKPDSQQVTQLAQELGVDTIVAYLLVQRGITTFEEAKTFFRPTSSQLHDPFLMKDMDLAVARIEKAIANNERILVYGDYDVDGTTAVSLVASYLKTIHPSIATYIPDRYDEGYGISFQGIDFAHDNDFSLIIALDCGIKAIDKVAYATSKGIDFIICDHHKPGDALPNAVAILNAKRTDCTYPYDELCGCGVGFKLISAIAQKRKQAFEDLLPYLDLVATAIAADIVPLTGENRVLAYLGLEIINTNPRNGIKALLQQVQKDTLTITDVVFIIAPRINAAGRIQHGNYAVSLLTEMDEEAALSFAQDIEQFNTDRRTLDQSITELALRQIEEHQETEAASTVVYHPDWHKGVIGIVASRLIETYYRPTLVFTKSGDVLAASARSVKGFDIYEALEACQDHLIQFGGHKYAAGLTLHPDQYEGFKQRFEEVVRTTLPESCKIPEIVIDAEIELSDISHKTYRIIAQMGPFGPQNMKPVFMTKNVRDTGFGKPVGADKSHLKLNVFSGTEQNALGAIGFGLGNKVSCVQNDFDIVYTLEENHWNGYTSVQLVLKDLR